jgi:CubicO group peptidase (beta-lactamase class C family)
MNRRHTVRQPALRNGRVHATLAGLLLLLAFTPPVAAQEPAPSVSMSASTLQPGTVEKQIDPFIGDRMAKGNIPGAVFVLVKDGQVVFAKGYGYADLETRRPMDPETTIVRAGSISKLLTATAVMQLYERQRVALDENVNSYLKRFTLEENFPQPVTLADLLTHTAGFAEYIHGQHQLDAAQVLPLAEYLARRMPPRVMPPGQMFSYNDHGMSLAGLVVEEVSGVPFAEYVRANIFQPLGMDRSTFNGRPDPAHMNDLATGYRYRDGGHTPYQLDYVHTVPAAGLYTTARDVSRFMIAQLQYGRLGNVRILDEATAREMQARHFAHHPRLRGRAYGFSELFVNGQRILFHDGAMPGFTSRLCLLPEHGLGFFTSYTSDRLGLKSDLTTAIMDALFPKAAAADPDSAMALAGDLSAFTGSYDQVAGFSTNAMRLGSMLENYATVAKSGPDALKMFGTEFRTVEPLLFRDRNGQYVAFRQAAGGEVSHLFVGSGAYEKLDAWDSPAALLWETGAIVLTTLPMGLLWPLGALVWPRRLGSAWRHHLPAGRSAAGVACFLALFFLASFVGLFLQIDHYWQIMRNEYPWPWITRLLAVPPIVVFLCPIVLVASARSWAKGSGTTFGRTLMSLGGIGTLLFLAVLWRWNLIGFNY